MILILRNKLVVFQHQGDQMFLTLKILIKLASHPKYSVKIISISPSESVRIPPLLETISEKKINLMRER